MTDWMDEPGLYFDRQLRPISYRQYAALKYETIDEDGVPYHRIAEDQVGESWVSTVWLGINHGYGPHTIIVFETMIFDGVLDGEAVRYSTEAAARAGHRKIVQVVRRRERGMAKHMRDERRHAMKELVARRD